MSEPITQTFVTTPAVKLIDGVVNGNKCETICTNSGQNIVCVSGVQKKEVDNHIEYENKTCNDSMSKSSTDSYQCICDYKGDYTSDDSRYYNHNN